MDGGPGWTHRSARFEFRSLWRLEADRERVWEELVDFRAWPSWWRGLESVVELEPGDGEGIGQRAASRWRGPLPYRLEFEVEATGRERPELLEGRASGDLCGEGRWTLDGGPRRCAVTFDWRVEIVRPLLRRLAPVAAPAYRYGHDQVMRAGAEGLGRRIDCPAEFSRA